MTTQAADRDGQEAPPTGGMKVLVTGGAGYIGSTVASACLDAGITPVILDDLSTGRPEYTEGRFFYQGDIADGALLDRIFAEHPDIGACVHCAALVVVPESVTEPLRYWRVNVAGTLALADSLLRHGCHRLVFSSSGSVYGQPDVTGEADFGVCEDAPLRPASPYARTKAVAEQMLADLAAATPLRVVSLRYFNPVGADPKLRSGLPPGRPSFVLNKLIEAAERGEPFPVTGTEWPTRDGTGLRDFIHVWDLAVAHVAALQRFDEVVTGTDGHVAINLGTGSGVTVRELVAAFGRVTGKPPVTRDLPPRPGDVAGAYARTDRAKQLLDWQPRLTVEDAIRDALRWADVRDRRLAPRG